MEQIMLQGFKPPEFRSIEIIKAHEPPDGYWLAFSGGKDSIVLYDLACRAEVKFDAHYNNTTCDPPELIYFMREYYPFVIWEHPAKSIWDAIPERGFPMRNGRWCCEEYKERGGQGRFVLTGIRAEESPRRRRRQIVESCYKDTSKIYVNPIIFWSKTEVWDYIKSRNLPYCSLYNNGWSRIGCVICPFEAQIKERLAAYPGYYKLLQRAFMKLYENIKHRPSARRWQNSEEMLEWWLGRNRNASKDTATLPLFS